MRVALIKRLNSTFISIRALRVLAPVTVEPKYFQALSRLFLYTRLHILTLPLHTHGQLYPARWLPLSYPPSRLSVLRFFIFFVVVVAFFLFTPHP